VEGYLGKRVRRGGRRFGAVPKRGTGALGIAPANFSFAVRFANGTRVGAPTDGPCPPGYVYASHGGCVPLDGGDAPIGDGGPTAPPIGGCAFGCPTRNHPGCSFDGQTQAGNPYCACCCVYDCGADGIETDVTVITE